MTAWDKAKQEFANDVQAHRMTQAARDLTDAGFDFDCNFLPMYQRDNGAGTCLIAANQDTPFDFSNVVVLQVDADGDNEFTVATGLTVLEAIELANKRDALLA